MKKNLLAFATLLIMAGCEQQVEVLEEPVRAVKTITVAENTLSNSRSIAGVVKNSNQSGLSFRVGARVASVEVGVGDVVSRGQVLAVLDKREYQLAVDSAAAQLASARADLVEKSDALRRQTNLRARDFVPQAAVDQAQAAFAAAESNVAVAETSLSTAQNNLDDTILTAPFDGVIAEKNIEAFSEVSPGSVVFEVLRSGGMEVDVLLPETLVRDVSYGDAVTVRFPTLEETVMAATVSRIGARADAGNAFDVTVTLSETPDDIRVGMTAQVAFNFGESNDTSVFLIPVSAIDVRIPAATQEVVESEVPVFVFEQVSNTAVRKMVSIRDIRGNEFEVTSGLSTGDIVITAGVPYLTDGQKVKLWQPDYTLPASIQLTE